MKKLSMAVAATFVATAAHAAPIGFGFNAGEINSIAAGAPAELQAFQVGEDLFVTFSLDDGTADGDPGTSGDYRDPLGTISIMGLTSGATLALSGGVEIEFDDNEEFELESDESNASVANPFILGGDIDLHGPGPIISDPGDLAGSIAELAALLDANGVFSGFQNTTSNGASIRYFDPNSGNDPIGLRFGPVPTAAAVPLPAGLPMMAGALGLLGFVMRRKKA